MSLKDLQKKSAAALENVAAPKAEQASQGRAVTSPGMAAMAHEIAHEEIKRHETRTADAERKAAEAEHRLQELQQRLADAPNELPLTDLVEIEGRRRNLTPEQFEELRANLATNPLVHPISVKKLENGKYEVISGHNRLAVYRVLGRSTIPVAVIDIEDGERSAFFANLLQPSLPAYERYLGFKKWRDETGESQVQIAERSGVSKATLSKLFAYEDLPEDVLAVLDEQKDLIGIRCAYDLARLAKSGQPHRILEALQLVAAGQLTEQDAAKFAARKESKPRAEPTIVTIKAGKSEFCTFVAKGNSVKIDFKDAERRAKFEESIAGLLKELAAGEG